MRLNNTITAVEFTLCNVNSTDEKAPLISCLMQISVKNVIFVSQVVAGFVFLACIIVTSVAFSYRLHEPESLCISILQNSDILLMWAERWHNSRSDSDCTLIYHLAKYIIVGPRHTFQNNFASCDSQVRCYCKIADVIMSIWTSIL